MHTEPTGEPKHEHNGQGDSPAAPPLSLTAGLGDSAVNRQLGCRALCHDAGRPRLPPAEDEHSEGDDGEDDKDGVEHDVCLPRGRSDQTGN